MRPKLDFRLSGRQYSLAMAEPSEVDQKSANCILSSSPSQVPVQPCQRAVSKAGSSPGSSLHGSKSSALLRVVCVVCVPPSSLTVQRTGTNKASPCRAVEEKPAFGTC